MLYTTLRMLHILSGIFWAGSIMFVWIILFPSLKRARVPVFPVRRAIPGLMIPILSADGIVLFGTGIWMTVILRGGSLGTLLTTAWGWAVFISFLATLLLYVIMARVFPAGIRMVKLARETAGRTPTPEETEELNQSTRRFYGTMGSVPYFVLFALQVITMLILRYL